MFGEKLLQKTTTPIAPGFQTVASGPLSNLYC